MLWVAAAEASKYVVELEGVKDTPGVRWVGGVAGTYVRHVVKIHLGDIGWGD